MDDFWEAFPQEMALHTGEKILFLGLNFFLEVSIMKRKRLPYHRFWAEAAPASDALAKECLN